MKKSVVREFADALQKMEAERSVEPVLALFADECRISNVRTPQPFEGRSGAARFWTEYLAAFRRVRSRFTRMLESDTIGVLEWVSEGELADGHGFRYGGVTMLELKDGRICGFQAYFDPTPLVSRPRRVSQAA